MFELLQRVADASLRREREPIHRWQLAVTIVAGVAAVTLPLVVAFVPRHYVTLHTLTGIVYGYLSGAGVVHLSGISRRAAWQRGFRGGRDSMIESLGEARARGLTFPDWLAGEMQRDGVPLRVTHDDDGHVIEIALPDEESKP